MSKFNPINFGYELIEENEDVYHYQKKLSKQPTTMTDIMELSYWNKANSWVLFIELMNLKQFLPKANISDEHYPITLFIGRIKNNQDFRFIMNKIVKDPASIIKMGC